MTRRTIATGRWLVPGALLALVAGGGLWWGLSAPPKMAEQVTAPPSSAPTSITETSVIPPSQQMTQPVPEHRTPSSLGNTPFASSLEGTDIDGALQADASGRLILSLEVRDFFDYFLNTVGEVSPETAIGQIQQMALQHLPESAAHDALALLDQYLAYKQASLTVMQTELDPSRQFDPAYQLAALGNALAQLKGLRRETFEPEARQAFFGMEEAYSEYTLATLAVQQRSDLTDSGKQALMDWHRNQLPEALRQTEQRLQDSTLEHQERVLAVETASSPEAAGQKLSDLGLDQESVAGVVNYLQQREAFDQRFQSFDQALQSTTTAGLVDAERQQHREELLQQHFPDEQEQTWARLKLLDQS
ncbi:lipase secretion chaperone [Marinobacter sp.]|uniref:lipase secretion chaperone n=1 Tax=Marinobacter sp. TaxID=50741 RepID=UPI0019D8C71D|nr:lipase secretion chaperone [Marinobacter sp.]MBE0486694.1 lipase chaperone [Marinobacter sp.]